MTSRFTFIHDPKLVLMERLSFWVILWVGTVSILWVSRQYFVGEEVHGFLLERPQLTMQDWWRYSLFAHVAGGAICMASSLLQYSKVLLKKYASMHKSLGYIYAASLILLVIPTGFVLSFVAKGGWVSQVGFFALNVSTLICVVLGIKSAIQKKITVHKAWITRSFALVTSAITFRALQVLFQELSVPYELIYPTCVWLSIILNVWLAEYYIFKSNPKNKRK